MWNFSILQKLFKKIYKKFLFLSTYSTFPHNFNGVFKFRKNFYAAFQSYVDIISRAPSCHSVFLYVFGRYVQL